MKTNRRTVLALLGSSALSACTSAEIVSRDATDPFEGGIGGTGIVGLLTDFGSLIVNGLRVEMTGKTKVRTAFGPVSDSALAPGQALTVYATRNRNRLVARQVSIDYALIGKVARHKSGLQVNGVPLRVETGAIGAPRVGQRVAVSGVWTKDGLTVSRFDPAPSATDLIAGTLDNGTDAGARIGGVGLTDIQAAPSSGQYTVALGRAHGSSFDVKTLQTGRFNGVSDLRQLSVEGYLEASQRNPGFRVAGLGHSFARDLRLSPLAARRAIYFGRYTGLFRAQLGYVMPESFAARRDLLRQGYEDGFDGRVLRI